MLNTITPTGEPVWWMKIILASLLYGALAAFVLAAATFGLPKTVAVILIPPMLLLGAYDHVSNVITDLRRGRTA